MQQEDASQTLLKPATLYFTHHGEESAVAGTDHRNAVSTGVSRTALHLAYVNSDAETMAPKKDADRPTVWSKMFNFVIQGLAIGGASLYPMDDFPMDERWPNDNQEIYSAKVQRASANFSARSPLVAPHWNWLASSREVATEIGAHLRKERDIKRAVDALSELDDQTLQDIGIPHRSGIEYVVRYCHDC